MAKSRFPYVAYVADAEAQVLSGPGIAHYATAKLARGYAVEVYRHDGEGWCAIRPPAGSYCLAPTPRLRIIDQRTAQVVGQDIPARIGSTVVGAHDAVQVLLGDGEIVQLLEPPTPTSPEARIAPPPGEFRWINARSLSRAAPVEGATFTAARKSDPDGDADPFVHLADAAGVGPTADDARDSKLAEALFAEGLGEGARRGSILADEFGSVTVVPGSPAAIQLADHETATTPGSGVDAPPLVASTQSNASDSQATEPIPSSSPSGIPRVRFEGESSVRSLGPLDPRVAEMDLRLSKIVAGDVDGWQFGSLRDETAALLAKEPTPEVRDQLRDLLDRVGQFESIHSRRRDIAAGRFDSSFASRDAGAYQNDQRPGMTGASGEVSDRVRSDLARNEDSSSTGVGAAPTQALYDAVGTLKPVVSRRQRAPHYALVDDRGEVVSLVTPTADVDLQQYVGRRIGVNGSRGFMPDLRRSHVTATRVTPLPEKMVR